MIELMGEYNHTIDTKGRLSIPSKFRSVIGEEFVISKGLDGCLFAYTNEAWEQFEQQLSSLPLLDKNARQMTRFFLAGAANVELDPHGRILIPNNLREYAGLDKDVTIVGTGKKFEIWNTEKWLENNQDLDMDQVSEQLLGKVTLV